MRKTPALILLFVLLIASPLWADESEILMPVGIFIVYYGTPDMDRVAEVVTEDFRDGKSKAEWAATTSRLLKSIKYERLESDIRQVVLSEDTAYVHVRARVDTVAASAEHDELYRVIRDGDVWKIDALEVVNEDIEARMRQL